MGRKIPCRANEGWVYKGGNLCSRCDKCPGGHGRDMSKKVLNTTGIYGDMECLECEVCPPKQYNNGGRKGCNNCLEDCAQRNRHNCSDKATQPCGECFIGFYENYQVPDDPSTCNPCTEREIDMFPACANFATSTRAAATWAIDRYSLTKNISETDVKKAVEMRNGHSTDGTSHTYGGMNARMDIVIGLSSICSVVAISVVVFFLYRYCKKRRKRSRGNDQKPNKPQQTASACPLLVGYSDESVSMTDPSSDRKDDERPGSETKVHIEDTDSAPENDSKAVPTTVDPGMWEHRREQLRSNNNIWRKCAQQWTELGKEYKVLSMPSNTIEQLKKEKEDKQWTNAEFCYEILKSWTQIKGQQATVKALCDVLFANGYYEIIGTILSADI